MTATLVMTSLFARVSSAAIRGTTPQPASTGSCRRTDLAPVGNFYPVASAPVQLRYPYSSWLNNEWVGFVGQRLPFTAFLNFAFRVR